MSKNTIKELAIKFNVSETAAYGLVQFLKEIKAVDVGKLVNPPGTKGKPSNTYDIHENAPGRLAEMFAPAPVTLVETLLAEMATESTVAA